MMIKFQYQEQVYHWSIEGFLNESTIYIHDQEGDKIGYVFTHCSAKMRSVGFCQYQARDKHIEFDNLMGLSNKEIAIWWLREYLHSNINEG